MARNDDELKEFIVKALACHDTPSQVVEAVKEEFDGRVVSRSLVQTYDPTKRQGRDLSKKWRDIFDATRKSFLETVGDIPVAHKSVRIRMLQKDILKTNSPKLRAELLEQVAKEVGDAYSNKRRVELTGADGNPLEINNNAPIMTPQDLAAMSVEDLGRAYQDRLQGTAPAKLSKK